jgi:hypothetical protein
MRTKHTVCVGLAAHLIACPLLRRGRSAPKIEAGNPEWLKPYNTMNGHELGALHLEHAIWLLSLRA